MPVHSLEALADLGGDRLHRRRGVEASSDHDPIILREARRDGALAPSGMSPPTNESTH
jgi:hypothetical protein